VRSNNQNSTGSLQRENIKISPDTLDILTGAIQTTNGICSLIDLHSGHYHNGSKILNESLIFLFSSIGFIILIYFSFMLITRQVLTSLANFFAQERVAKGEPFTI
jgi:hypothetical protein